MPKQWPSLSNEELGIKSIENYYYSTEKALRSYYKQSNAVFASYTLEELIEELNFNIDQLDKSSAFMILASMEAYLRRDYIERCKYRKKDRLSREFQNLYNKKTEKAHLSEDILELWKQHTQKNYLVSEIRAVQHYRNWLAHGRYLKSRQGRKYDFFGLRTLAAIIQTEFRLEMGA